MRHPVSEDAVRVNVCMFHELLQIGFAPSWDRLVSPRAITILLPFFILVVRIWIVVRDLIVVFVFLGGQFSPPQLHVWFWCKNWNWWHIQSCAILRSPLRCQGWRRQRKCQCLLRWRWHSFPGLHIARRERSRVAGWAYDVRRGCCAVYGVGTASGSLALTLLLLCKLRSLQGLRLRNVIPSATRRQPLKGLNGAAVWVYKARKHRGTPSGAVGHSLWLPHTRANELGRLARSTYKLRLRTEKLLGLHAS
mmetsp:Transcript_16931/g.39817  ORF Transcript_16931/g.39817 Transcript_16931/m.39817 type:complete len:250 (-) Transcript_16931:1759-2508(-)